MENLEQYWEQSFSPIGRKFTVIRPNYQDMGETDSMVAALYWLELEMYNGGFLQFFCNWGYDAYLLAIKGLEQLTQHIQNNFFYRHTASSKDWKMTANYKSYGIFPNI